MNRITVKRLAIPVILVLLIAGIGMAANAPAILPKVVPPAGFTDQQIQQAQQIGAKDLANASKNLPTNNGTKPLVSTQGGTAPLYAALNMIEDKYIVNGGPLKLPIRTEIWDNNFAPTQPYGGYPGGFASYNIYYWNYYTQSWYNYASIGRWTDSDGVVRIGFSIPYKLSDKFFIDGNQFINPHVGSWPYLYYQKFFTVSWY